MRKTNFFLKFLKYISKFINSLLEKNLNKLNFKNFSHLFKNNKIVLIFVALLVVFTSYLLLPTFYKQSEVNKILKNELIKKFDINFKFSQSLKYNFFPRPHFIISDSSIIDNKKEIAKIKKLKVIISIDNFLSLKNIKAKDLILENANFNLNKKNINFFYDILGNNFKDRSLTIKNSKIFFRNLDEEVLFINKILKFKYYHENKELKNIFYSENEIFNIPFSMKLFFNKNKTKISSLINSNLLKLQIEDELTINKEKKNW